MENVSTEYLKEVASFLDKYDPIRCSCCEEVTGFKEKASGQLVFELNLPPRQQHARVFSNELRFSPHLFAPGVEVVVSDIFSPNSDNVMACCDKAKFDALQLVINSGGNIVVPLGYKPVKDEIVLAPIKCQYHRGKIVRVSGAAKCEVIFIDVGGKSTVDIGNLRLPNRQIVNTPIYGMTVGLDLEPGAHPIMLTENEKEEIKNESWFLTMSQDYYVPLPNRIPEVMVVMSNLWQDETLNKRVSHTTASTSPSWE